MANSLDTLVLGPFVFTDFSPPDQMGSGGQHRVAKHELLGGRRVVDMLGASPDDRQWSGIMFSETAVPDCLTIDALRVAGQPLSLTWGAESRTVVVTKFNFKVEKFNFVHYDITCMVADNNEAAAGGGASFDLSVGSDLSSALGMVGSFAGGVTGALGGIGSIGSIAGGITSALGGGLSGALGSLSGGLSGALGSLTGGLSGSLGAEIGSLGSLGSIGNAAGALTAITSGGDLSGALSSVSSLVGDPSSIVDDAMSSFGF